MSNESAVIQFIELSKSGRNAALDVDTTTGNLICRYTDNQKTGVKGAGTPPVPFESCRRIAVSVDGWLKMFETKKTQE